MNTLVPPNSVSATFAGKYLTVDLAGEIYGIAVLKVREIVRLQKITPIPQLPAYIRGVLNLRGCVIPIVDLRVKFGLSVEFGDRTCVVVVRVARANAAPLTMGLIVDGVNDVARIDRQDIEATPEFGGGVDTAYLHGMAKVKDVVVMLLDIDRVVNPDALETLASA